VVEGTRRAGLVFDGQRVDEVLMAVLRPEWEQRRAGGGGRVDLRR